MLEYPISKRNRMIPDLQSSLLCDALLDGWELRAGPSLKEKSFANLGENKGVVFNRASKELRAIYSAEAETLFGS